MAPLENKNQLKKKYKDEQVFVVPFDKVSNIGDHFTRMDHNNNIWSAFDNIGKYIYRYDAEGEPVFQQIIPYILIQNPNTKKFYTTERIGSDSRLLGSYSLGVGGHIDIEDGHKDVVLKGLFRELYEEMDIEPIGNAEFIGYVRDLNSKTNDHLGLVFLIKSNNNCKIKETDKLKGKWMSYDQLEANYSKFEDWAKHIIDYMCGNNNQL